MWTEGSGNAAPEEGLAQEGLQAPVWAVFGDLMAAVLGAVVLALVGLGVVHLEVEAHLQQEVQRRQQEERRRLALEQALAAPLAQGRVTLREGRIGISGSVLFDTGSDILQPEGRALLHSLVQPLRVYLGEREEVLMVSGFTDSKPLKPGTSRFADNLELSAQRALTVTRALVEAGLPSERVFAAAFGPQQPVASNETEAGRALNRRVEIAPVPRLSAVGSAR